MVTFSGKISLIVLAVFTLAACSDVIDGRGTPPDEFSVVVRPPLTLPPNFTLRPAGETSQQNSQNTEAIGRVETLFTHGQTGKTDGFDAIFGTDEAIPDIRSLIDEETLGIQFERRVPLEVLLGGTPEVGPDLDGEAEALRIRHAIKDGKPLTETPTLANDPIDQRSLLIE